MGGSGKSARLVVTDTMDFWPLPRCTRLAADDSALSRAWSPALAAVFNLSSLLQYGTTHAVGQRPGTATGGAGVGTWPRNGAEKDLGTAGPMQTRAASAGAAPASGIALLPPQPPALPQRRAGAAGRTAAASPVVPAVPVEPAARSSHRCPSSRPFRSSLPSGRSPFAVPPTGHPRSRPESRSCRTATRTFAGAARGPGRTILNATPVRLDRRTASRRTQKKEGHP